MKRRVCIPSPKRHRASFISGRLCFRKQEWDGFEMLPLPSSAHLLRTLLMTGAVQNAIETKSSETIWWDKFGRRRPIVARFALEFAWALCCLWNKSAPQTHLEWTYARLSKQVAACIYHRCRHGNMSLFCYISIYLFMKRISSICLFRQILRSVWNITKNILWVPTAYIA